MKNFCYWQDDAPITIPTYQNKICLLREAEYRIEGDIALSKYSKRTNIFCPYGNAEEAKCCLDYIVMERLNEEYSK